MTRKMILLGMLILIMLMACDFQRLIDKDDYQPTPEKFKRVEMPIINDLDAFIIEGDRQ